MLVVLLRPRDSLLAVSPLLLDSQVAEEVCQGFHVPCTFNKILTGAQRPLQASPVASRPAVSLRTRPSRPLVSLLVAPRLLVSSPLRGGNFEKDARRIAKEFGTNLALCAMG